MQKKINLFFENFEQIIKYENEQILQEYPDQLSLNPKDDLTRLGKTLIKIKFENETVSVDTFQDLYNLIHKTNLEIR
jgi:hypothetical protein